MEKRSLGRTGHHSTVVAFGTAALGRVTQDVADVAVELILEYGVNHIDIAPTYGQAMERMAPWMPKIRDQVFLGAKTRERTKGQAWENIRSCMSRLAVESFELFQLHSVGDMEALDQVTGNGGGPRSPDRDARAGPHQVDRHHRSWPRCPASPARGAGEV